MRPKWAEFKADNDSPVEIGLTKRIVLIFHHEWATWQSKENDYFKICIIIYIRKLYSINCISVFSALAMNFAGNVRFFLKILTIHKIYATLNRSDNSWLCSEGRLHGVCNS